MWRTMRFALALTLCLATLPARAWEFEPLPVCTLRHDGDTLNVVLTYDPSREDAYAIALTRAAPWPDAPLFGLRFDGPLGLLITTDRHVLSEGGRTLTVTDRGFGNVLNGLEFNLAATALTGPVAETVSLDGAAGPVQAFRACRTPALS